jgi:hypothetical protein
MLLNYRPKRDNYNLETGHWIVGTFGRTARAEMRLNIAGDHDVSFTAHDPMLLLPMTRV